MGTNAMGAPPAAGGFAMGTAPAKSKRRIVRAKRPVR
jgi:hypothetical protein